MKKRIVKLLWVLVFTIFHSGCGGGGSDSNSDNQNPPENRPPVAIASVITVDGVNWEGSRFELNGSQSYDEDSNDLSYLWEPLDTSFITVDLINSQKAIASFVAPEIPGDENAAIGIRFQLTVTDSSGEVDTDTVTVFIENISLSRLGLEGCSGPEGVKIEGIDLYNSQYLLCENNIRNIDGVANLVNLKELIVNYSEISDISPLKNLTNLEKLHLNGTVSSVFAGPPIENIEVLTNLSQITDLNLHDNGLDSDDLTHLINLKKLTKLNLSLNYLTNIDTISSFNNLFDLDLSGNHVTNIEPLSQLSELRILNFEPQTIQILDSFDLRRNFITDLTPLQNLGELRKLNLAAVSRNNVALDITPLSLLNNLEELNLKANYINDISPLSNLINLQSLDLGHLQSSTSFFTSDIFISNNVSNITALSALQNLEGLDLSGNKIVDISSIYELNNLVNLNLSGNSIRNIDSLSNLQQLDNLNLGGIRLYDGTMFVTPDDLHNFVIDINPLNTLVNLKSLDLSYNCIVDFSGIPENIPEIDTTGQFEPCPLS